MVPEIELSVRQQIDARAERLQRESELEQKMARINHWYTRGLITSDEKMMLVAPVEFELKRLTRERTDIPFRGESVQNGASATDAAANDAEVMSFNEWRNHWTMVEGNIGLNREPW